MPRNPFREPEQEREIDRRKQEFDRERERGERPSWREVDKARDRSRHSDQGRAAPPPATPRSVRESPAAQREAARALDALFSRPAAPGDLALRALRDASTPGEREAALRTYAAAHGMPADWEVLVAAVDVRDEALCAEVMRAIAAAAPGRASGEKQAAVAAVRARAFTLTGADARAAARAVVQACAGPG